MSRLLSDVWTGLRTVPARAGLVLVSLTLGLFAATILLSTLEALRRQARDLVREFGAESFALVLPSSAADRPWTRDDVEWFRVNLGSDALVSGVRRLAPPPDAGHGLAAVDADLARVRGWRFMDGRALDEADMRQGARHAVATAELCRERNWRTGQIILLGREPFRLTGILESAGPVLPEGGGPAVFVSHGVDALETAGEPGRARVDILWFRATGGGSPETLKRRVASLLNQPGMNRGPVDWITPESLLHGIRRWQRSIAWTAGSSSALGLLLGAVTLAGLLLTGVRERIPEIGLRRAVGARRRDIAALFVAEALALAISAGLIGVALAEATLRWLGGRFPMPFYAGWSVRLLPLGLAVLLALLCSMAPAVAAARLEPAEALRND